MTVQLIFSEKDLKDLLPVSLNLAGEYMAAAMFEAQEIGLKTIIGGNLLRVLKERTADDDWTPQYEDLRDRCKFYLIYQTMTELLSKVSFKVANAGAISTNDANITNLTPEQINAETEKYQAKADFFCYELQRFICHNRAQYPELEACDCAEIEANLRSMASCGILLGGARAFILPGEGCC